MKTKTLVVLLTVLALAFGSGAFSSWFLRNWEVGVSVKRKVSVPQTQDLASQVAPAEGMVLPVKYGDIGPKLIEAGAIDLEKFKEVYQDNPLTEKQLKILTEGSKEEILINSQNAHFLLNLFWALGLANKNPILEEGEITKYGSERIGNFASTGGWTLGKKDAMQVYSRSEIVSLTSEQQAIVEEIAKEVFRPCCDNPTSLPDCNHGMAALGLAELLASRGASTDEIFNALKVANSFWFTNQYIHLARYFEAREGRAWQDVPARLVLGREYSSGTGFSQAYKWLTDNKLLPEVESQGGSCG